MPNEIIRQSVWNLQKEGGRGVSDKKGNRMMQCPKDRPEKVIYQWYK